MRHLVLSTLLLAAAATAQQSYPKPTPAQQAGIDKDNSRLFGSSPSEAEAGPLASASPKTALSPVLTPQNIDKALRKVADWELRTGAAGFDQVWTSSALYTGYMAAAQSTVDPRYRDAMLAVARKFNFQLAGRIPNADTQAIAQMYLELYLTTPSDQQDTHWIEPTRADLDSLIPLDTLKPGDPRIPWWWCDALFMAPPVWSRMYLATGEHKYIDYLNLNFQRTSDLLYNKTEHLYARDAVYLTRTEPNGKPMFWSRGNGWVMAGIARIYGQFPPDDPRRPFYANQLKEMATRVAALQDPKDGLWHAGLLDPEHYPLPEISGSAFFTFAIAWGINHHILDRHTFEPVVAKAWRGMLGHIYADGRLGCIQQTGAEPAFYYPTSSYDYGIGAFLLAASELKTLVSNSPGTP